MRTRIATLLLAAALTGCGQLASPALAPGTGTVAGRVLAAPGCPVERAGSPCPAIPVSGASVRAVRGGQLVATGRSGAGGRFVLRLRAGSYVLTAQSRDGYRAAARAALTVRPGRQVSVTLTMDSGIR